MNRIGFFLLILGLLFSFRSSRGSESDPIFEEPAIHRIWYHKISLDQQEVPLQNFLDRCSKICRFSFFIDRRLDPDLPISCSMNEIALIEGLRTVANDNDLSLFFLDQNLYVGPKTGAGELQLLLTLHRHQIAQNPKIMKRLLKKDPFRSPFGSEPKSMLEDLARKSGFQWIDLDRFPHDCWNELDLKPLSTVDLLSLILVGFHLRFTTEKKSDEYRLSFWNEEEKGSFAIPDKYLDQSIKDRFSACRFEKNGSSSFVSVQGSLHDLAALNTDLLNEWIRQKSEKVEEKKTVRSGKKNKDGIKELSGSVKNNKLGDLFDYLEKSFDLRFELDPSLKEKGIDLKTLVSCEFNHSRQNDVLEIVAKALNCQYRLEDGRVLFY